MTSPSDSTRPTSHVAIFPPATHQPCKLDTRSQSPTKPGKPSGIAEAQTDLPTPIEDQEAERWDGMS